MRYGDYGYDATSVDNPYDRIRDVFVYDSEGRLVENARLFDQNGNPIRLGYPGLQDPPGLCTRRCCGLPVLPGPGALRTPRRPGMPDPPPAAGHHAGADYHADAARTVDRPARPASPSATPSGEPTPARRADRAV